MTSSVPEIFVDLGNVSEAPPATESAPGWNLTRVPRLVIVAIVALLLVGSSVPVPRPLYTLAAEAVVGTNAQFIVDGDRMYVASYDLRNTLSAYDLRSHRRLWSTDEIDQPGQTLMMIGPTIVASSSNAMPGYRNTEAIDAATGRSLWTSEDGSALQAAAGILVQAPMTPEQQQSGYANPLGYQLLDPRSGQTLWSIGIPDGCVSTLSGTPLPNRLIEACPGNGTLHAIDLADGRPTAERYAPLGGGINPENVDPSEVMGQPQLVIVGDTLLIAHANAPVPTVDAYDLDTLATRWTGLAEQFAQGIMQCGDEICFYQTPDVGFRVDVATGKSLGPADPIPDELPSPDGTLLLVGSGGEKTVIPTGPAGVAEFIQPDGTGMVWLARPGGRLIGPLLRAGRTSCEEIARYVVCATTDGRIRAWYLPS